MMYKEIEDWDFIQNRIKNEPAINMPDVFLNQEIKTDHWNNIPVPMIEATEQFKKGFEHVSRILYELMKESGRKN
jgi:hypothetical protein